MADHLVSIIIPVYNGSRFIEKTINSCIEQTHSNIEIIIIDDCSYDDSFKICSSFKTYKQIKLYRNKENLGLMITNNFGFSKSNGDYIIFLGHDDLLKNNHVEVLLTYFDNDTSFVHCNSELIDSSENVFGIGVKDKSQIQLTKRIKTSLVFRNVIHSTGAMINAHIFNNVDCYDLDYTNYGEWLLWIKLANKGKVKYTTDVTALYRRHETNITNTFSNNDIKLDLQKYFNLCQSRALSNLKDPLIKKILTFYIMDLRPILVLFKRFLVKVFEINKL